MIKASYISVIIIWSTTPLAIQWSSYAGPLFGVTSRMLIGLVVLALIFMFTKQKLFQSKDALITYLAAGLGIYLSMSLVYWGAQFIPSGWISVIFGLSPIMTGVLSIYFLHENHFTPLKMLGMTLGVLGLLIIFSASESFGPDAIWGVCGIVTGTFTHAFSAVLVKRINAPITGLEATFGGLLVAVPLFTVTYITSGEQMTEISNITIYSILYLGVIATAMGFSLYYFILQKMDAIRVSLITLVTPICALILGKTLNEEQVTFTVLSGTAFVLVGLALFEFDNSIYKAKACSQSV